MSWKSIEAFDHAQSGLEHLVATVKSRKDRKSNLYSLIASAAVVMAVCYVVAGFFSSTQEDAMLPSDEDVRGDPKLLMPSFMTMYQKASAVDMMP
jgi:hypothetical protein